MVTALLSSRAAARLARPKAVGLKGTCIPLIQCLIPKRADKVLQLTQLLLSAQVGKVSGLIQRPRLGPTHGISIVSGVSEVLYSS